MVSCFPSGIKRDNAQPPVWLTPTVATSAYTNLRAKRVRSERFLTGCAALRRARGEREFADPGAFSATRESDLNTIPIGDERYETPDAVVLGG